QRCSAFAAALAELDARLARLPVPEPPAGAADRAIAGFRAAVAASGTPGTAPLAPPPTAARPLTPPPSPSAGPRPPSQAPPARPPRAGHARGRRWRRPVSLAAAAAAAITLVVALIAVLGPGGTAPAYAAILREAAVHTGAEKSALFDLSGAIGLSLRGQRITAPVTGTGATEFPDRGKLTEVTTLFGKRLQQDIVSVGNRVWDRANGGQWVLVPFRRTTPAPSTRPSRTQRKLSTSYRASDPAIGTWARPPSAGRGCARSSSPFPATPSMPSGTSPSG